MGCFLGCFGSSKDGKRRKPRKNKVLHHHQDQGHVSQNPLQHNTLSTEQAILEKPLNLVSESRDEPEEQLSLSAKKKVTFDTNVKAYEPLAVNESIESLSEIAQASEKEKEESVAKSSQSHSLCESDSITSSVGSYPPNHRYQNCRDSDDEGEDLDNEESDEEEEEDDDDELENYDYDDEVEDNRVLGGEVWSKSTSTLPARAILEEVESPMIMSGLIEQELEPIGLNRNARRDRSVYSHPVLNPVENLTQWKAVKSKGTNPLKLDKENSKADQEAPRISFSSEPSFKFKFDKPKSSNQEIAVDSSLSSWLVSSETTPVRKTSFTGFETSKSEKSMSQGSNSVRRFEDRPILGALTVEELKQFSASASPRRSPSRSPDDMAIIGTVGTYWNLAGSVEDSSSASSFKGIPNTTSKYREDKRVSWHSTPFETRLERALNRGSSEA